MKFNIEKFTTHFPNHFKALQSAPTCIFFKQLESTVNTILSEHPEAKSILNVLGEEQQERVADAVLNYDFSSIYEIKGEYTPVLKAAAQKNKLKHEIIRWRLQQPDLLGLSASEVILIRESLPWCETIDEIFIAWRRFMKESSIGRMLANLEEDPGVGAEWLKKQRLDHAYSVIKKIRDKYTLVPLQKAYTSHYQSIEASLLKLIQNLKVYQKEPHIHAFNRYFRKLQRSYANPHLARMEKLWRDVDIAWLRTPGKIQFIHGMEKNYIDPTGIRVAPSLRIVIEDAEQAAVNATAKQTQHMLEKHFARHYHKKKTWAASREAMKKIQLQVCIPITFAGEDVEFLGVGKIVPERSDVRRKYGTKIFLDYNGMEARRKETQELFRKVFGPVATEKYFCMQTAEIIAHFITGHEVGHGAFVDNTTISALTPSLVADMDEVKATWCGMMCAHFRYEQGEISREIWTQLPIMLLAGNLRYLRLREETTLRSYYNSALLELRIMMESGLITKTTHGWMIQVKNIPQFYTLLRKYFERMIDIYDQGNQHEAQKIVSEMKTNKEIEELYHRVTE
ncbi:MAG: hypothetical protein A3B74_04060 [Candidatus Kerfeldbacteria bacterium RIFCSPHIGHO2_02_FULL_42_14]|uniref:DUF7897 domain-containing protein n=1 Tax=Candidatus Kerfeldbacteria bacterium RIFCSPHIGHO2_02_FULL_42_14 TaxID=1798540 RepID=A0A1G2AQ75_9BACT|nr:MAG: hypothetical protein A3B74_04060 [Candidatus Kerfeldbacteria bacterium RIFCSPHIGHO2_02_FULL_42_14]OGY80684.1 MAG: hypothetical protein A3E60_04555 [Candidatus Kerfeldbacteria bacterium RIFCSPHIGHO2_12_FULL_42_13]OGY82611.1 MAG: hypothetical protein A3I91_04220 [Candidatus Kerfeldbacteria bacterium RIFCSPLOWO2_02_FULL_42_19]OGY85214.1 MAG: hypothetical protein A3G01_01350 [Candidatus Kerfeldbacteria bacterium RIFCSPLOWO2_12_FULL_43_9]